MEDLQDQVKELSKINLNPNNQLALIGELTLLNRAQGEKINQLAVELIQLRKTNEQHIKQIQEMQMEATQAKTEIREGK